MLRAAHPSYQVARRSARKVHDWLPGATAATSAPIDSAAFSPLAPSHSQLGLSATSGPRDDSDARLQFRWFMRLFSYWLSRTLNWARALQSKGERLVPPVLLDNCVVSLIGDVEVLG